MISIVFFGIILTTIMLANIRIVNAEDLIPEVENDELADPNGFKKYEAEPGEYETITKLLWMNKYPIKIIDDEIQVQYRNIMICYDTEFGELSCYNINSNKAEPPRKSITDKMLQGHNKCPDGLGLKVLKKVIEEVFDQAEPTEDGEIKIKGIEPITEEIYIPSSQEKDYEDLKAYMNQEQRKVIDNEPFRQMIANYYNGKGLRTTRQGLILPTTKNIGKLVIPRDLVKILKDEVLDTEHKGNMIKETACDMINYTRYAEKTPNKILLKNGYYDFDTMEFKTKSDEMIFITKESPYNYCEDLIGAPVPESVKELCTSLKTTPEEDLDYDKHIRPLLQCFGYLLTDGNPLKCLITFIGETDSGKGIAIKIMMRLLNDKISQADIFNFRNIHNEQQESLIRNDLNVINEFTAMKDNAGFRNITGNDPIETRKNYCGTINHPSTEVSKTILSTNRLNKLIDTVEKHDYDRLSYYLEFRANYTEKNLNLENSIINDHETMEWILANSINELKQSINHNTNGYELDCHHNETELLNMMEKYENPEATLLKQKYIYDPFHNNKNYTNNDYVKVEDIKELLPHIRQTNKINELLKQTYDHNFTSDVFYVQGKSKRGYKGLIYRDHYIMEEKE